MHLLINLAQSITIWNLTVKLTKIFSIPLINMWEISRLMMLKPLSIEVIDKCIRNLKPGKACGPDELSAERLQHAHPIITKCIHKLFSVMINYDLAPKGFGSGIVVPLVKDKTGYIHSANNYRPITLVPIISKLFEAVNLDCYGNCFVVDDLQFGFKKG